MRKFTKKVSIKHWVRSYCQRPYPNHPQGCPNFGKRDTCPPKCPYLEDIYDESKGFWIVWVEFDFAGHCKKMKQKHPDWSKRQIECCLYWQGSVNKELKKEVREAMYNRGYGKWHITYCPEAMGVDVTQTMKNIGVKLEWPPKNIVRKVALIGVLK